MHRRNIRNRRKIQSYPDPRIVLIRDGIHANLRIQLLLIVHGPRTPHVSQHFAQAGSRGLSTYLRVTLREYGNFRPVPVEIELEGQTLRTGCYVLAFANAAQYGNNVYIAPQANLRDGLLDMCLMDALPPWRAVQVVLGMALGTMPRTGGAAYRQVRQATVRAAAPLGYHADGDYLGHTTEFELTIRPLALEVAG